MDTDGQNRRAVPIKEKIRMLWQPDWHVLPE
jgi:hypothetical protein